MLDSYVTQYAEYLTSDITFQTPDDFTGAAYMAVAGALDAV